MNKHRSTSRGLSGRLGGLSVSVALVLLSAVRPHPLQGAESAPASFSSPTSGASSVDRFRQLLSLPKVERTSVLASYPEPARRTIQKKLNEYDALSPEERELRLQATQLRAYLLPLMQMAPGSREAELARVNPQIKPIVVQRLQQWDILPPPLQKEVLAYESTIHYFLRIHSSDARQRPLITAALPEERRRDIQQSLDSFQHLSVEEQRHAFERFQSFFSLTPGEKKRALDRLPETERQQLESTLLFFDGLAPGDRETLFQSFRKFASLTPEERAHFLQSAQRWQSMSAGERNTWRKLITSLPPLPPGFDRPASLPPGSLPSSSPPPKPPTGVPPATP